MIGRHLLHRALAESNLVSTSDPIATLADAGIDLEALNELIAISTAAYADAGLGPFETVAAAYASGLEIGVRAARLELHLRAVSNGA